VADFEVELGAAVVVVVDAAVPEVAAVVPEVAAVVPEVPDELDEEDPDPDPNDAEVDVLRVVTAFAVVPGISLDTRSPIAAAAPVATKTTARDVRRTRAPARSRRLAPSSPVRKFSGPPLGGVECPTGPSRLVGMLMGGMSPCEPRGPRTAG
jgi:hypothetical protein